MSWSSVSTNFGSASSVTSFTPTFPSSLQEGDIVMFSTAFTPDDGSRVVATSTPNWRSGAAGAAYFVYARYTAALAAPVINVTNGLTATVQWFGCAFRSTKSSAFGPAYEATGTPPAGTSIAVIDVDTLIVCAAATPGDVESWNAASGFTVLYNRTTGPAINFSFLSQTSPATVSTIRTTDSAGGAVRNNVLAIGESSSSFFFSE